jgi:hypothetical protein
MTMRRASISAIAAGLAAVTLLVTALAAAALSPAYNVVGVETAATATQGTFVGTGRGSGGDALLWKAVVDHTALSTDPATPASITGGTLDALSVGGGELTPLNGTFTNGTITFDPARSSTAACGNQVYDVEGSLALNAGTGAFSVFLTHHRVRVLGRCVTFAASVVGAPGLTITPSGP